MGTEMGMGRRGRGRANERAHAQGITKGWHDVRPSKWVFGSGNSDAEHGCLHGKMFSR